MQVGKAERIVTGPARLPINGQIDKRTAAKGRGAVGVKALEGPVAEKASVVGGGQPPGNCKEELARHR